MWDNKFIMWDNKLKAVTFSYDDGVEQDIRLSEILNRYGLKCTFNVNSQLIGSENRWDYKGVSVGRLSLSALKKIYQGHEVAAHGCVHKNLKEASYDEAMAELKQDKASLEKSFGCAVKGMAYAFGTYNPDVIQAAKDCGLGYARTVKTTQRFDLPERPLELAATCHHDDERLFELADAFVCADPADPMLFYVWGHSYEFDGNKNWDRFELFCEKIAGHPDICYCTNAEAVIHEESL